jgi:toxin ParE1/3/4
LKRAVFLRPAADRDLEDQAQYIAETQDLDAALAFYAGAEKAFALIMRHPEAGTRVRLRHPLLRGTRAIPLSRFTNHLVFYRVGGSAIEIVRILHGARALENLSDD